MSTTEARLSGSGKEGGRERKKGGMEVGSEGRKTKGAHVCLTLPHVNNRFKKSQSPSLVRSLHLYGNEHISESCVLMINYPTNTHPSL
jgi:hypothetical protein